MRQLVVMSICGYFIILSHLTFMDKFEYPSQENIYAVRRAKQGIETAGLRTGLAMQLRVCWL